jgi:hypothetical protein
MVYVDIHYPVIIGICKCKAFYNALLDIKYKGHSNENRINYIKGFIAKIQ